MVQILDATLREGEQTPGVYFDSHIKLAIAGLLDKIGIDIIEAGHPLVSPEIHQAVKLIASRNLNALVGAHSRSVKKDVDMALECGVTFLGVFFCVAEGRLDGIFSKTLLDAIDQICEVIRYAKEQNPNLIVRFTPEDTVRSSFDNVVRASTAAVQAGADIISVADTTGYMIPGTERNMFDYVTRLRKAFMDQGINPKIAVHCHNDRGLALANVLDAYRAGVDFIDASVLGLGERAGIVDLASILVILRADFGEDRWNLTLLPELYDLVSNHARVPIPVNFPITGRNAFTHCAGVHTQAALKDPLHYQSLDPSLVGKDSNISLDHMSGVASIRYALEHIGEDYNDAIILRVLEKVKSVGHTGRSVDFTELRQIVQWCKEH